MTSGLWRGRVAVDALLGLHLGRPLNGRGTIAVSAGWQEAYSMITLGVGVHVR